MEHWWNFDDGGGDQSTGRKFVPVPRSCFSLNISRFQSWHRNMIGRLKLFGSVWWGWLRHCPTSRKFSSSIPDGVTGTFHWLNSSWRNMALWTTQPLKTDYHEYLPRNKDGRFVASCTDFLEILTASTSFSPKCWESIPLCFIRVRFKLQSG